MLPTLTSCDMKHGQCLAKCKLITNIQNYQLSLLHISLCNEAKISSKPLSLKNLYPLFFPCLWFSFPHFFCGYPLMSGQKYCTGDSRSNHTFSVAHHCDSKSLPVQLLCLAKAFVQCVHAVYTVCSLVSGAAPRDARLTIAVSQGLSSNSQHFKLVVER